MCVCVCVCVCELEKRPPPVAILPQCRCSQARRKRKMQHSSPGNFRRLPPPPLTVGQSSSPGRRTTISILLLSLPLSAACARALPCTKCGEQACARGDVFGLHYWVAHMVVKKLLLTVSVMSCRLLPCPCSCPAAP